MARSLPPPGPDHYAARRARWLAQSPDASPAYTDTSASPSTARLQRLLAHPDPHTDPVWNRGIDKVWKGLVNGGKLKRRLPMSVVIKIIHAAWRRDPDTWPEDALVPDSDPPCAPDNTTAKSP